MDLFDVVRSCFRRWYVLLPLLLIVGWFGHSVYSSVKPVYYGNAVLGISAPSTRVEDTPPGVPLARNGLLETGGAQLVANLASLRLVEASAKDRVVAAGGLSDYESKMFPTTPGMQQLPLIMIEVTNADPVAVRKTLELVVAQADITLRDLQQQAQVPEDQMVTAFIVASPGTPWATMPSRTRSTVALVAAGVGLSVLFTVVLDVLLTRRRRNAKQRPEADEDPAAEAEAPTSAPALINSHDPGQTVTAASAREN